jgi:hypothetical protein
VHEYVKKVMAQIQIYIGRKFEKDIKEQNSTEAYMYLDIETSNDIEHKNEGAKLKKEYFRGLRLVLGTELSTNNKIPVNRSCQNFRKLPEICIH